MLKNWIFQQLLYFPSQFLFFENINIYMNNVICVKLPKVLWYYALFGTRRSTELEKGCLGVVYGTSWGGSIIHTQRKPFQLNLSKAKLCRQCRLREWCLRPRASSSQACEISNPVHVKHSKVLFFAFQSSSLTQKIAFVNWMNLVPLHIPSFNEKTLSFVVPGKPGPAGLP
jgi:hypothetical protein